MLKVALWRYVALQLRSALLPFATFLSRETGPDGSFDPVVARILVYHRDCTYRRLGAK